MLSPDLRQSWINHLVDEIQDNFLDGVNFDFEDQVLLNETSVRDAYTNTVKQTSQQLKAINLNYQVATSFQPFALYAYCIQ